MQHQVEVRHNLTDIREVIKDRRTIYPEQFSDRIVHREIVEDLLNCAIWAPSHGLTQPWRFKVYDGDSRQGLSEFLGETYTQFSGDGFKEMKHKKAMNRPLKSSVVIIVGMEPDPKGKILDMEEMEATACAVQNMHLMATARGVGMMWSTPKFLYTGDCNEFFGFSAEGKVMGILYLGYPEIDWPTGQRRPIEYVTDWKNG